MSITLKPRTAGKLVELVNRRHDGGGPGGGVPRIQRTPIIKIIDTDTALFSVGAPLPIDNADIVILQTSALTSGDGVTIKGISGGYVGRRLTIFYIGPEISSYADPDVLTFITFEVEGGTNRNRVNLRLGNTWRLRAGWAVDLSYGDPSSETDSWFVHNYYMPWWHPNGTDLPLDEYGHDLAGGLEAEYVIPRVPTSMGISLPYFDETTELDFAPSTITDDGNGVSLLGTLRFAYGSIPLSDDDSFPHAPFTFSPGGGDQTVNYLGRRDPIGGPNRYATWVYNIIGNGDWTFAHNYGGSIPAGHYPFHCPDAEDFVLKEGEGALMVFDAEAPDPDNPGDPVPRWCIVGQKVIDSLADLGGTPATSSSPLFTSYGG